MPRKTKKTTGLVDKGVTVHVRGDKYRVPNDRKVLAVVDRINANDLIEDRQLIAEGVRLVDMDGKRIWPR